jgi:hypothetical protein
MDRLLFRVLATRSSKHAGARHVLAPGDEVRVGRAPPCDLVIADDHLSASHFRLRWTGRSATIEDLQSIEGTTVNAGRIGVGRQPLEHGAWVRAGQTDFGVYFEAEALRKKPELLDLSETASAVFHQLSAEPYPIFGVLDCARDGRILPLLREAVDEHRCLFEGPRGRASEAEAPHLVQFADDSDLLRVLIGLGWGQRFGIFFASDKPFEELRRHFRRLLVVTDEETGERMYFRFYDPTILRAYLPAATRPHSDLMFGPVSAYLCEGPAGEVLRFAQGQVP